MSQEFGSNVLDQIKQKGFYSYGYISNFEKFKKEWTSKEKLCSPLTDKQIIDKEYENVLNVWNKFEMKTMKDYHDFYFKYDVLLFADVFQKLKNNSLKNCGLCPSYHLSASGLRWDAILKIAKVKLDLIQSPDMYIFFEKGTRAGISSVSNRYSKANDKYLTSVTKQESKHIIYSDEDHLYSYAMSKFLLTSELKWIGPKEFDMNKYTSNRLTTMTQCLFVTSQPVYHIDTCDVTKRHQDSIIIQTYLSINLLTFLFLYFLIHLLSITCNT